MAFYKTILVVGVLSEEPVQISDLSALHESITYGDWSGDWEIISSKQISNQEMKDSLINQGSDPEFFNL